MATTKAALHTPQPPPPEEVGSATQSAHTTSHPLLPKDDNKNEMSSVESIQDQKIINSFKTYKINFNV